MQGPWNQGVDVAFEFLVDTVVMKASVITLLGGMTLMLLRRSSAARRHAVLLAVVAALALLPVLSVATGSRGATGFLELRTPTVQFQPTVSDQASSAWGAPTHGAGVGAPPRPWAARLPSAGAPAPATLDVGPLYRWAAGGWAIGAVLLLVRALANVAALRRLRSRANPAPEWIRQRVDRLAARVGVRPAPAAVFSSSAMVPGAFGWRRPMVVLPSDAVEWDADALDTALLHELTHIRRRDFSVHACVSILTALYWVNPLVWWTALRLGDERERACDDAVLVERSDAIRYAQHLLWFARRVRSPQVALSVLGPFGPRGLSGRIRAVLDPSRVRAPLPLYAGIALLTLSATVALSLGRLRVLAVTPQPAPIVSALQRLDHPNALERRRAAWSLGELEARAAVDGLIESLADPDPRVRTVAAWALGEIKDDRAAPALTTALDDPSFHVREMAVLALGELGEPRLLPIVQDLDDSALRSQAAWAAVEMRGSRLAPAVWTGALAWEPVRAKDLDRYVEQLTHGDAQERARAAEALGRIGRSDAVGPLLDALDDDVPAVRAMVVWALDEINPSRALR